MRVLTSFLMLLKRFKKKKPKQNERDQNILPFNFDPVVDKSCTTSQSSDLLGPGFSIHLPVELWLIIIHHTRDAHTLAQLMAVNHSFYDAAESMLYGAVSLISDFALIRFSRSLSHTPRRKRIVRTLFVALNSTDSRLPLLLVSLLPALTCLERLTLNVFQSPSFFLADRRMLYDIFKIHIPSLREFATDVYGVSRNTILDFCQRHPHLERLDLTNFIPNDTITRPEDVAVVLLPSLVSLTCHSTFLDHRLSLSSSLTHLSIACDKRSEFLRVSQLLGSRIVSLRLKLGYTPLLMMHTSEQPIAFHDVLDKFPRLRFFQVDMIHSDKPHASHGVIRWWKDTHRATRISHPSITVAWIYARPDPRESIGSTKMLQLGVTWHEYLNAAAKMMFEQWGGCGLERLIYRHTIIPYVSVTINEDDFVPRLVRTQDLDMHDEYWRDV